MLEKQTQQQTAILVVDDEESLRDTFQFFLRNQGYAPVVTAQSYDEAISELDKYNFDLIISDIVLGSHSGIDFLRSIREKNIDCPVVMITGYPNVETAAEAVRLGAFDYIPKPVEKDTLLKIARLALKQQQLEQEKKAVEQEKERYRVFLETVFKSVTDCIITVDANLRIMDMNPAARLLFNELHTGPVDNSTIAALCAKKEYEPFKNDLLKVLKSGVEITQHRQECHTTSNQVKVLSVCTAPLQGAAGSPDGIVVVIRDMSNPESIASARRSSFHRFIGESDVMQAAYTMIENVGRVDLTALITGESGTGKELAAEALHQESHRKNRPLIKVDCTAIPENLLESELFGHRKGSFTGADRDRMGRILQADGGTLFLDEIGDISHMMQLRLLRFLQESTFYPVGQDTPITVDVRVITATNVDLKEKVNKGEFREDLYFRLRVIDVMLPALRERGNDITLLANYFIEKIAPKISKSINGISDQALEKLYNYPWPGNVRELKNVIERACVLCEGPSISTTELPPEIVDYSDQATIAHEPTLPEQEPAPQNIQPAFPDSDLSAADRIMLALKKTGGNKAKAARLLQIDRTTLYRKIKEFNLDLSRLDM
ncbi:sigma-54 dependent transcriptional regulator [Desulfogranum marinum]|uniref:sigma-54 dependent transcriptional regulator n=1 Tax=Desulfogranum marinum TaxID=453220 RepID=UPI001962E9A9|nr:sigma 54-interacting transcriptional regulator [Desulfogranum marinum]MBM9512345.1 sigma 54-interacting transcriptional regulator [Desulfogranum marinum]